MRFSRVFRFPWRSRRQIEQDVDAELAFHLEMRIAELLAAGVAREAAQRRAREEFGDLEYTRAYCRSLDERTERAVRTADWLADWRQDLRLAWRTLRHNPGFAVVALLTLTLAVGANTAVFSVIRAVLLRPLPYGAPGSLVAVYEGSRSVPSGRAPISPPNFVDYRAAQHLLAGMAAYDGRSVTWRPSHGDPQLLDVVSVTGNVFDLLQVRPLLGRAFTAEDDDPASAPRVILSYRFWQGALGGDTAIVGRTITLNDLRYTVVGIMPRDFTLRGGEEMWAPLDLTRPLSNPTVTRKQYFLHVLARLKPGVPLGAAQADLGGISARLADAYPEANTGRIATLVPLQAAAAGDLPRGLLLLQLASALVLLIACVNLANITLSRTIGRRREMALRAALGAGRARLVRQLLTESVLLAMTGGALGTVLAAFGTRALLTLQPDAIPARFDVRPDGGVLLFALALSAATGIAFGLLPALDAVRADLDGSLRDGARGVVTGAGREGARRGLVAAQVGIAALLLVGAGLLIRSFVELTRVRLGFDHDHVLTAEVRVSGERYDSTALVNRFYDQVLDRIRQAPGVVAVGATMRLPTSGRLTSTLVVEGQPADPTRLPEVGYTLVRGDYFETIHLPLLAGRTFDRRDTAGAPGAVIVNQAAARAFLPGGDPSGRRVRLGPDATAPWSVVVGMVGDMREEGVDIPPAPAVYASHVQNTWWRSMAIAVRTTGDPRVAAPLLREAVRGADPTLALRDLRTLDDVLGSSLAARRFALGLVACFGGLALVLAALGIYGVLAFSVTSRTREFGIRLALGATRREILLQVMRHGLTWSLLGLATGVAGAALGGRLLQGMLYGVRPADWPTLAAVAMTLLAVAVAACLIPASRATRVDPSTSLRAE